ncbi:SDR family NAD(P)-dependent oxidoreductase [Bacillus piscicola]|uniref:SDR family NAD(P)-dependent oxidoreductase n=1 Tax=Bacillus piscicola TaxID=1632684 RepID=UPI001F08DE72|nr:SDR family oxidoreductase [Bacillus piscicola]
MSIQGRVAIVTGSGRGIGAASAVHLAKQGAKIVLNYLNNREAVEEIQQKIDNQGGESIIVQADVMTEKGADSLAQAALDNYGSIDILVCNAGPLFQPIPLEKMTWNDLSDNLNQDMKAAFFITKTALKTMTDNHFGRIIYIGSGSSKKPTPGLTHHGSSRAALASFAMYVAKEMSSKSITANVVAPGMVKTDRTMHSPGMMEKMASFTPVQRIATPNDVARAIGFFANDEEGFYTGVYFPVDGGLSMG